MQKFLSKEQEHNAAVFKTHELETRLMLLTDENRSLNLRMGSVDHNELATKRQLDEKSKEFDDLTARFEAMHASQGVTESRIRDEFAI